jgi:hypothetical protein
MVSFQKPGALNARPIPNHTVIPLSDFMGTAPGSNRHILGMSIMEDADEIDRLLAISLALLPAPRQPVLADVMAKLKEIACSYDSALWQSASDQLIASAKEAMLETDAQFYLTVASACIGCSVSLARQERSAKNSA